jgi:hypothetical protein
MIYRLNKDIGEYKEGTRFEVGSDELDFKWSDPYFKLFFGTWLAIGLLDPVKEGPCEKCGHSPSNLEYGKQRLCTHEGRWKPKADEMYWVISMNGVLDWFYNKNDSDDKNFYSFGNVFPTREQAEEAAKKVKSLLLSLHEK